MPETRAKIIVAVLVVILVAIIAIIAIAVPVALSRSDGTVRGFHGIPGGEIVYNPKEPSTYEKYVEVLNKTLKPYQDVRTGGQVILCDETTVLDEDKVCILEANWLSSCSRDNFGFSSSQPCVLLTYRNDTSFVPEVYESLADIPQDIPDKLNSSIYVSYYENSNKLYKVVWVYCNHAHTYLPVQGFYKYYFPNKGLDAYLPPVVGVVLNLPDEEKKNVECTLWSKTNDGMAQRTSLSFTIQRTSV